MTEERRSKFPRDRRRRPRGGRRPYDNRTKPWYLRRRLWLAAVSLVYVAWQRVRSLGRRNSDRSSTGVAA